jgi:ADP-dependent NAD(P)H-hydrate dehydratase
MAAPELVTPELLRDWPLPDPAGSKDSRGEVLVAGGAAGTPGGVALAGLASLRVGAGRIRLALASSVAPALAVTFP